MLCACYAYDNEKNNNHDSFLNFQERWDKLTLSEKKKVVSIFYSLNDYEMFKSLKQSDRKVNDAHRLIMDFVNAIANEYGEDNLVKTKKYS